MLPASEPAFGSVRPKVASFSPVAWGTSQRCFCSSVPPLEEGEGVEADVDAHGDAEEGVDVLEFVAGEGEADVVEAGAAVALGDGEAEDAELTHLPQDFGVELGVGVPPLDVGGDFAGGELADHVADLDLLVGELEVHGWGEPSAACLLGRFGHERKCTGGGEGGAKRTLGGEEGWRSRVDAIWRWARLHRIAGGVRIGMQPMRSAPSQFWSPPHILAPRPRSSSHLPRGR